MIRNNKRGISPLIATVLVIGFTIVLAALVITWGTRLFQTTVAETEIQSTFSVVCSTGLKLDVTNRGAAPGNADTSWSVTLRNNNQDQEINDFTVVLNFADGTSEEGAIAANGPSSNVLEFPVPVAYDIGFGGDSSRSDLTGLESVDFYPQFTIDGVTRSCENPINVEV